MEISAELQEKLRALQESYADALPEKLAETRNRWKSLPGCENKTEELKYLHRVLHSLAGSGGTFGYDAISQQARQAEQLLAKLMDVDWRAADPAEIQAIDEIIGELNDKVEASPPETQTQVESVLAEHPPTVGADKGKPLIYLIEDDEALAQQLFLQLQQFGYHVQLFNSPEGLIASADEASPSVIIMDVIFPESPMAGITAAASIRKTQFPSVPVVFLSSRTDLESRLQAIRAGGAAYFTKPMDIHSLVDRLDALTAIVPHDPYRVLIVDDDPVLAEHYALTLEQAGIGAAVVNEPQDIIEGIAASNPDLILMDVYLPVCSGLELAQVIRQDEAYFSIPIMFLSTETNPEVQFEALSAGGDDILAKPIRDIHLVTAVKARAERARALNSVMIRDSLTGLLKHTKIKEQVATEISRARRHDSTVAIAMVDIDHFKNINDSYGHQMGDRIIKNLSRLLFHRLRSTDVVGRYGGEEFIVILPDTDAHAATGILEELRREFAGTKQTSPQGQFAATFSAGIARYPEFQGTEELIKAADNALYRAKKSGRNRVETCENTGIIKDR